MTNTPEQQAAIKRLYMRQSLPGDNFIIRQSFTSKSANYLIVYSDELELYAHFRGDAHIYPYDIYRFKRPRLFDGEGNLLHIDVCENEPEPGIMVALAVEDCIKNGTYELNRALKIDSIFKNVLGGV